MSQILIAGGTGMLKEVSLYFTKHAFTVSVIARNQNGFNNLIQSKEEQGFINPIKVDYTDYKLLKEKIISAIDNFGNIETCICWIHSTAPEAPYVIAKLLNNQNIRSKFYHIAGSENIQPDGQNKKFERDILLYKNITYRKIILGFVIENDRSRWLTDLEISNGVIDAVTYEKDTSIVGTVEPWESRP